MKNEQAWEGRLVPLILAAKGMEKRRISRLNSRYFLKQRPSSESVYNVLLSIP